MVGALLSCFLMLECIGGELLDRTVDTNGFVRRVDARSGVWILVLEVSFFLRCDGGYCWLDWRWMRLRLGLLFT